MTELVSAGEIRAAARRIDGVRVRTQLLPFPGIPGLLIKPESLQPIGAFKLRGAYNAISALAEDPATRPNGVVAHSSGNHGFAVAYAAALLELPAAIVVPENAAKVKTDAIAAAGAELVYVEPTLPARVDAMRRIARTRGYAPIAPFDDRQVIAGQGTIGLEIAEDLAARPPRAVLVPVGGGGLISGVAVAVKALMPSARVIGVEPELAADVRESLRKGARVAWPASDTARTRADALRTEQVGELTFPHIRQFVDDIVTVSEDEILRAIRRLALEARLVAEPGGAVAVAAYLFRSAAELGLDRDAPAPGGTTPDGTAPDGAAPDGAAPVVAVLSGGNVDPALLAGVLAAEPEPYNR